MVLNEKEIKKIIEGVVRNKLTNPNKLKLTGNELKKIIENEVINKFILFERDLLKVGNKNQPPPPDDMNMEGPPPEESEMLPPEEEEDPGIEGEQAPPPEDSNVAELVELLTANPDRAEGVLKYAKGIIGNDTIPENNPNAAPEEGNEQGIPPQPVDNSLPESRNINLDEMINDIFNNDVKKKPTITRPINRIPTMKNKMFRPSL
jgi:hypothetical protein